MYNVYPKGHEKRFTYLTLNIGYCVITLSGMTLESKKNAHLQSLRGTSFVRLNEGVKITQFM